MRESEQIYKNHLSSNRSLKLENVKLESQVIANDDGAVNW